MCAFSSFLAENPSFSFFLNSFLFLCLGHCGAMVTACHQYSRGWVSWIQLSSLANCFFSACGLCLLTYLLGRRKTTILPTQPLFLCPSSSPLCTVFLALSLCLLSLSLTQTHPPTHKRMCDYGVCANEFYHAVQFSYNFRSPPTCVRVLLNVCACLRTCVQFCGRCAVDLYKYEVASRIEAMTASHAHAVRPHNLLSQILFVICILAVSTWTATKLQP